MRWRNRFLLGFVLAVVAAVFLTGLTYAVVFKLPNQIPDPSEGVRVLFAVSVLGIPFLWMVVTLLGAAWYLGQRIAGPLAELRQATERLKSRDLDFAFTYQGKDEIGEVVHSFSEMQRELKESLEREWRDQESRREMMAALAHDLRTPLTLVRGHAETLLAAPPERRAERMERYLGAIAAGAHRATTLLDDLVFLATVQQSDFKLNREPVALQESLAIWAQEYRVLAEQQGVALAWAPDPSGGDLLVECDPVRIHQVVDNLVTNALRYTPPKGEITVRTVVSEDRYQVEVQDTGPGFAAADLPHLFDRFFQGGQGAVGAAGLGLYICKLLVERHSGTIQAGNRPEGGGWVRVGLPVG